MAGFVARYFRRVLWMRAAEITIVGTIIRSALRAGAISSVAIISTCHPNTLRMAFPGDWDGFKSG
jgi:hypothetical protein